MPIAHCTKPPHEIFREAIRAARGELTFAYPSIADNVLRVLFASRPVADGSHPRVFSKTIALEIAKRFVWSLGKETRFIPVVPVNNLALFYLAIGHVGVNRLHQPFNSACLPLDIGKEQAFLVTDTCYKSFPRQASGVIAELDEPAKGLLLKILESRSVSVRPQSPDSPPWKPREKIAKSASCLFQCRPGNIQDLVAALNRISEKLGCTILALFHSHHPYYALVHVVLRSDRNKLEIESLTRHIREATTDTPFATLMSVAPLDPNPNHPIVQAILAGRYPTPAMAEERACLLRELCPRPVPPPVLRPAQRKSPSPEPLESSCISRAVSPDSPSVTDAMRAARNHMSDPVMAGLVGEALEDLFDRHAPGSSGMRSELETLMLRTPQWLYSTFFGHVFKKNSTGKDVIRNAKANAYLMFSDPLDDVASKIANITDMVGYMMNYGVCCVDDMFDDAMELGGMVEAIISIVKTLGTLRGNTHARFEEEPLGKRPADQSGGSQPAKIRRSQPQSLPAMLEKLSDPNPLKDTYRAMMQAHIILVGMEPEDPLHVDWAKTLVGLEAMLKHIQLAQDRLTTIMGMFVSSP